MERDWCIREALPSDAVSLGRLYGDLVDDPDIHVSEDAIEEVRTSSTSFLLVANTDNQVLGTVLLCICPDVMYARQPFAVIENLIVSEDSRGLGIGSSLLQEVDRICLSKDCSKIMLLSSEGRKDSHEFFRAQGYRSNRKAGFVKYRRDISS